MDNLFQLPCEFQYHLIIPSMLTGLQVVWEAYGTPVLFINNCPKNLTLHYTVFSHVCSTAEAFKTCAFPPSSSNSSSRSNSTRPQSLSLLPPLLSNSGSLIDAYPGERKVGSEVGTRRGARCKGELHPLSNIPPPKHETGAHSFRFIEAW